MKKITGFLRLVRPANLVTSVSDVLAGIAISGFFSASPTIGLEITPVILLSLSTIGLYGGGVVFNDVFDSELDKIERPERPIPMGLISKAEASALGAILLISGILAAFIVSTLSGLLAISIAFLALFYNKWGKHFSLFGPLNMGLCRGFNLLLGISIIPATLYSLWFLALVPVLYISSITMISRGEVHGGSKSSLYTAALFYVVVIGSILYFSLQQRNVIYALIFLVPFCWMIFTPLTSAIKQPTGSRIGKAVKAGVIALILMNAAWAAACGEWFIAVVIVLLLPVSLKLGRLFAVT